MEHKFRASVRPPVGYGIAVSVVNLPYAENCDVHLFHWDDANVVAATCLKPSELAALILALQGAQAILNAPK